MKVLGGGGIDVMPLLAVFQIVDFAWSFKKK